MTTLLPPPIHPAQTPPEPTARPRSERTSVQEDRPSFADALAERRDSIQDAEKPSFAPEKADSDAVGVAEETAPEPAVEGESTSDAEPIAENGESDTAAETTSDDGPVDAEPTTETTPEAGAGQAEAQASAGAVAQQPVVDAQPLPVLNAETGSGRDAGSDSGSGSRSASGPHDGRPVAVTAPHADGSGGQSPVTNSVPVDRLPEAGGPNAPEAQPVETKSVQARPADKPVHRDTQSAPRPDAPARQAAAPPAAAAERTGPRVPGPSTATPSAAPTVEQNAAVATDATTGGDARSTGDDRGRPTPSFADRAAAARSAAPAVARAVQVETAVQLENVTGRPGVVNVAPVLSGAPAAPALAGGLGDASPASLLTPQTEGATQDTTSGRVVRGLTAMVNQRGGTMTMRLTPPELGQLRIQMSIVQGTVSAQFTVNNPQAEAMIERSIGALRSALESSGLNVERLGVQMSNGDQSTSTRHDASDQSDQSSHDAAEGESRGRQSGAQQDADESAVDIEQFAEAFQSLRESDADASSNGVITP